MKKKKQMKIILAIVAVIAVLIGGGVMLKPGGLKAETRLVPEAAGDETGISVKLEAPDTIQTYHDKVTETNPAPVKLTLTVGMKKAGVSGAQLEIPYKGFIPEGQTGVGEPYQYFETVTPILSYDDTQSPSHDRIDSIQNDTANKKLVIKFKETVQATFQINLVFKFNSDDYLGKIPQDHCVWDNLQAFVYSNGTDEPDAVSDVHTIKTNANANGKFIDVKLFPEGKDYVKGDISIYTNITYNHGWENDLDLGKQGYEYNMVYVDIPEQFALAAGNLDYFNLTAESDDVPAGYVRHYRLITKVGTGGTFQQDMGTYFNDPMSVKMSPIPALLNSIPEDFKLITGMRLTWVNGETKEVVREFDYKKVEAPKFKITIPKTILRAYRDMNPVVNLDDSTNSNEVRFSTANFNSENTIRNEGTDSIKNVRFILSQPDGVEKINFAEFYVKGDVNQNDPTDIPTPAKFRVDFIIEGGTNSPRTITGERVDTEFNVVLPKLGEGEYIQQVIVVPMGTTGTEAEEGVFPPGTSFGSSFLAKNWLEKWPTTGETITKTNHVIQMTPTVKYQEENKSEPTTVVRQTLPIFYVPANAVQATAKLIGVQNQAEPGQTVTYSLQGYNLNTVALADWKDPVVYFAVPQFMQLLDGNGEVLEGESEFKTLLSDNEENKSYITFIKTDNGYNYYKFDGSGQTWKKQKEGSFSAYTELVFKLKNNAPANNSIPIPTIVVSNSDKNFVEVKTARPLLEGEPAVNATLGVSYPMNNLDSLDLDKSLVDILGRELGNTPYAAFGADNSDPVKVLPKGGVVASSQVKIGEDGDFKVPVPDGENVEAGETVQIKHILQNTGEGDYEKIRLYDRFPFEGDSDGSTGKLEFQGFEGLTPEQKVNMKVYYTTVEPGDLPGYDTDLSTWSWDETEGNEGYLNQLGFNKLDLSGEIPEGITAIYIDVQAPLTAGSSFEAIMDFKVPETPYKQTVTNQYLYSMQPVGSTDTFSATSSPVTINTVTKINIKYDANLPTGVAETSLVGMPENPPAIEVDEDGNATYSIPADVPKLPDVNYDFAGWQLEIDGELVTTEDEENPVAVVYQPGVKLVFDAAKGLNWTLVAQWTPQYSITVPSALTFEQTKVPLSTSKAVIPRTTPDFTISTTAPNESQYSVNVSLQGDFTNKTGEKELSLPDILTFKTGATNTNGTNGLVPLKGVAPTTKSLTIFKGKGTNELKLGDQNIGDFVLDLDYVQAMPIEFFLKATSQQTTGAEFTATIEFALTTTP